MATATQNSKQGTSTGSNDAPVIDLSKETSACRAILDTVGKSVTSITRATQDLAIHVVNVRESIVRSVKSKKTGKVVSLPDWGGRSPEYQEWYKNILVPMIEEVIPQDFRGTIRTRLQNQVQEQAHKRATPAAKAHLGMAAKSKAQTQADKREAAAKAANSTSPTANSERDTDEAFTVDSLIEAVKSAQVLESCQNLAAMSDTLARKIATPNGLDGMTASQRRNADTLVKQAINHLLTARAALDVKPTESKQSGRTRSTASPQQVAA